MIIFTDNLTMEIGDFWTSGSSEGILSADHPMWCATNQFMNTKVGVGGMYDRLKSSLTNRYMALELRSNPNRIRINNHPDFATHYVICENSV